MHHSPAPLCPAASKCCLHCAPQVIEIKKNARTRFTSLLFRQGIAICTVHRKANPRHTAFMNAKCHVRFNLQALLQDATASSVHPGDPRWTSKRISFNDVRFLTPPYEHDPFRLGVKEIDEPLHLGQPPLEPTTTTIPKDANTIIDW